MKTGVIELEKYTKFARVMDIVAAVGGVLWAIYMVVSTWPNPTTWTWVAIAFGVLGIPLAMFDWATWMQKKIGVNFVIRKKA